MSKTFLITSHTEGQYPFEQRTYLYGLVKSLKKFFPDSFVLVASQSSVDTEIHSLADYVVIDRTTVNYPYGAGELALIDTAISILEKFNRTDVIKLVYDFIIDDTNFNVFDHWLEKQKSFVGCYWKTNGLGIGSWCWYGKLDTIKKLFNIPSLNTLVEWKLLENFRDKNLEVESFLYDDQNEMFLGHWDTKCDLVSYGGTVLKFNYGTILAAIDLTDQNQNTVISSVNSLLNQNKNPNHILFIDKRTVKNDLRCDETYQEIFNYLAINYITWNLVFYYSEDQIFQHLSDLGHTWCCLIKNDLFLNKDTLKSFYREIILDQTVGCIKDKTGNLFFKNKVIPLQNFSQSINNFILDKIQETDYNSKNI